MTHDRDISQLNATGELCPCWHSTLAQAQTSFAAARLDPRPDDTSKATMSAASDLVRVLRHVLPADDVPAAARGVLLVTATIGAQLTGAFRAGHGIDINRGHIHAPGDVLAELLVLYLNASGTAAMEILDHE
jgi:hypothetical protein